MDIRLKIKKRHLFFVFLIGLVGSGGFLLYSNKTNANPLPSSIQSQVSFKTIYPSNTNKIDSKSYLYKSENKVLSFTVKNDGENIVFTQQPAPDNIASGNQTYFQTLGLHPYAQFQTDLGSVALTKFWQTGSLKPYGQTAFLISNGTMLNAHSNKDLTNAEWKDLFENLKISP